MLARHSLAWLHDAGWQTLRSGADDSWRGALEQWQRADWPLVARRADADAGPGEICLGLAQAPDPVHGVKRRLPLRLASALVRESRPPLLLEETLAGAPAHWSRDLEALRVEARAGGIALRVFGSLAQQALTGAACVTPGSDIDLLFHPDSEQQLADGIWLLSRFASRLPLDGEVVFPDGDAVAWKEWANAMAMHGRLRVLVKGTHDVRLAAPEELLAQLRSGDA